MAHNEGDEPRFTQPMLYKAISKHPNPAEIYNQKLISDGIVGANIAKEMEQEFKQLLQDRFDESKEIEKAHITRFMQIEWEGFRKSKDTDFISSPDTSVPIDTLKEVAKIYTVAQHDSLFKKTQRLLAEQKRMVEEKTNWIGEWLNFWPMVRYYMKAILFV